MQRPLCLVVNRIVDFPVSNHNFDFSVHVEGQEERPLHFGATPEAAVEDLFEDRGIE